jgi:DNA-binding NarL/FixJ family response regulator
MARRDGVDVVAEAADGHGAIEQASIHQPQVVLLDIDMPSLDGIKAIQGILQVSPDSNVIMYSAYGDQRMHAMSAGAHGWITKSADWQQIKQTITYTLEQTCP